MAQKKKRDKKCKPRGVNSEGKHGGGGKTSLSEVQKVLLGGGIFRSMKPVGEKHGRGERPSTDVEQAQKRTRVEGIHKVARTTD